MLIYIGQGSFYPDVPARNLSDAEVEQYGGQEKLLQTGLWRKPGKKELLGGQENKIQYPGEENK